MLEVKEKGLAKMWLSKVVVLLGLKDERVVRRDKMRACSTWRIQHLVRRMRRVYVGFVQDGLLRTKTSTAILIKSLSIV